MTFLSCFLNLIIQGLIILKPNFNNVILETIPIDVQVKQNVHKRERKNFKENGANRKVEKMLGEAFAKQYSTAKAICMRCLNKLKIIIENTKIIALPFFIFL
jgi:hypothetical protein